MYTSDKNEATQIHIHAWKNELLQALFLMIFMNERVSTYVQETREVSVIISSDVGKQA